MIENVEIDAETLNGTRYFLTLILSVLGGIYLSLIISVKLQIPALGIIGCVVSILPFFLIKRLLRLFSKKMNLVFYEDHFNMILSDLQSEEEISREDFFYKDITSFILESGQSDNSYTRVNIAFSTRQKFKYPIKGINGYGSIDIGEFIYKNIKLRDKNIFLQPSFIASKIGAIVLTILCFLWIVFIGFHIFYSPHTSPASLLIGVVFFINVLSRRKNSKETCQRLMKYHVSPPL